MNHFWVAQTFEVSKTSDVFALLFIFTAFWIAEIRSYKNPALKFVFPLSRIIE